MRDLGGGVFMIGLVGEFAGEVSASEFLRSIEDIMGGPDFDALRFVIDDFSAVSRHELVNGVVEPSVAALSSASRLTNPNIRVVAISSDKGIAACVAEVNYKDAGDGHHVHLVPTMADQPGLCGARAVRS